MSVSGTPEDINIIIDEAIQKITIKYEGSLNTPVGMN